MERVRCESDLMYRIVCGIEPEDQHALDCTVSGVTRHYTEQSFGADWVLEVNEIIGGQITVPLSVKRTIEHYILFMHISSSAGYPAFANYIRQNVSCAGTHVAFVRDHLDKITYKFLSHVRSGEAGSLACLIPQYVEKCRLAYVRHAIPTIDKTQQVSIAKGVNP